jgi:hypothetical protein
LISLAKAGGVIMVTEIEVAAIRSANPAENRYFLIESIPILSPVLDDRNPCPLYAAKRCRQPALLDGVDRAL